MKLYNAACAGAAAALRELGIIQDKRRKGKGNAETKAKQRWLAAKPPEYRARVRMKISALVLAEYWRDPGPKRQAHRTRSKTATAAYRAIRELGIQI